MSLFQNKKYICKGYSFNTLNIFENPIINFLNRKAVPTANLTKSILKKINTFAKCLLKKRHPLASHKIKASYTVEASIVLPLFVGFVAGIMMFFYVIAIEHGVGVSLMQTARESAVCEADSSVIKIISECNLNIIRHKVAVEFIDKGILGIDYSNSSLDNDYLDICARYSINLPMILLGNHKLKVEQHGYARRWKGYEPLKDSDYGYVYVTKKGVAYHESLSCPYLKLSIKTVEADKINSIRNYKQGKYHKCDSCKPRDSLKYVYVTDYGTEYHGSLDCNGLKRIIYRISVNNLAGYHPCDKCVVR